METVIFSLASFLLGGTVVSLLVRHALYRHARPHQLDPEYGPAARAVLRHLRFHATINLAQAGYLLSIHDRTVMRYLDQMERDRLVKLHAHRGVGVFYTLP